MTDTARYWMGSNPTECDICHEPIGEEFVDGQTGFGPWANMCMMCFGAYGRGIGQGSGQHYRKQTDGRFKKIAG